jgi:serine/threonine protein kinase
MTKTTVGSLGTMRWRAPELLQDEGPSTRASDVYSTGMVFYEVGHTCTFTARPKVTVVMVDVFWRISIQKSQRI